MSIASIWSSIWPIIIAILFFGLIIFFHELGHFLTAKWMGIRVNEFAIGMGPKLIKKQGKETLYSLRAFPFGGFVAMEGEEEESDDKRAFNNKAVWRRIIVIVAGALVNIIMGIIIVFLYLNTSDQFGTNKVSVVTEGPNQSAPVLQVDDEILKINNMRIYTDFDISIAMSRDSDGEMDFLVRRNGEKQSLKVAFDVTERDGQTVINYNFKIYPEAKTFGTLVKQTFKWSVSISRLIWISLLDMISGNVSLSEISGPVGIIAIVGDSVNQAVSQQTFNFGPALMMMAFIALNVGIFNLLPIPVLDGGRLVFLIIEGIRGKPINQKVERGIMLVFWAILIVFMVVVLFNDVFKLFTGNLIPSQ